MAVHSLNWLAVVASIGAAIGELTSYYAGRWGRDVVASEHSGHYQRTTDNVRRYGGFAIFIFALTPLPFDIVGIAAGTIQFPLGRFLVFCWAGRFLRALVVVYAGK